MAPRRLCARFRWALERRRTLRELGALSERQPLNIVGVDIVEVAPCYDVGQVTSLAAVQLAHEILCLIAAQRA